MMNLGRDLNDGILYKVRKSRFKWLLLMISGCLGLPCNGVARSTTTSRQIVKVKLFLDGVSQTMRRADR